MGREVGGHRAPPGVWRIDAAVGLLPAAEDEHAERRADEVTDLEIEIAAIVVDAGDPLRERVGIPGLHEHARQPRPIVLATYEPTSSSRTRVP